MREPTHTNRLIHETSPYLRQHAHNPVDWYPWGPEALAKAKAENRPILLSVGYSACHWCHVMERESFEDASIARLMNEHFVNIKAETVRQILDGLGHLSTFKEVAEPLDKELLDRIGRAGAGGTTGREGSASRKGAGGRQGDCVRLSQIHLFSAGDRTRRPAGDAEGYRISNRECRMTNDLHPTFEIVPSRRSRLSASGRNYGDVLCRRKLLDPLSPVWERVRVRGVFGTETLMTPSPRPSPIEGICANLEVFSCYPPFVKGGPGGISAFNCSAAIR